MSLQDERTAIVFIHGVGIQDRFQQLTEFSEGLYQSSGGGSPGFDLPSDHPDAKHPLANFVPLVATDGTASRAVEVHEVFWGPLLNGRTTPLAVLRWVAGLLWKSISLVTGTQASKKITSRPSTSAAKWRYQLAYIGGLILAITAIFWVIVNAAVLALDQTTYLKI